METIQLADTSRVTTRLGFGCAAIVGGLERKHSLKLLDAAYDSGIRHFDVAPMYGYGTAEEVLGEFLQRRSAEVTVSTKFGLLPQHRLSPSRVFAACSRRLRDSMRRFGPARALVRASAPSALHKSRFTAEDAMRSLEQSRKRLRIASVDVFLMHEASADDLSNPPLLAALQHAVRQQIIGAFGVGSEPQLLPDLILRRPEYCRVIQSNWSITDPALQQQDQRFRITHRALHQRWHDLYERLERSPDKRSAWSDEIGCDLGDRSIWPKLLLRASLTIQQQTISLFSTRNVSRVAENANASMDQTLTASALRLHQLLHTGQHDLQADEVTDESLQMSLASRSDPRTVTKLWPN